MVVSVLALAGCTGIIGVRELFYDDGSAASTSDGGPDLGRDGSPRSDGSPVACNADLLTDPTNCGGCGHDCLGGACTNGTCEAVTVTSITGQPYGLAVVGGSLYFSDVGGDKGVIYQVDKLGTNAAATPIAMTSDPLIYDLRADAAGVVFSSGSVSNSNGKGVVESVGLDGGNKHLIATTDVPRGLAIDPQNAYFVSADSTPIRVETASRTASDGGAPRVLASNEADGALTWVDGLLLFWGKDNAIRRCTLPACPDTLSIAAPGYTPQAIVTNTASLFFGGDDKVFVMPKTATNGATLLAGGQAQVVWLAADDRDVVWADTGTNDQGFENGAIVRCQLSGTTCAGGNPQILAHSTKNPRVVAMDEKAIYFTVQYEGKVWRIAR